jgi:ferredoxin
MAKKNVTINKDAMAGRVEKWLAEREIRIADVSNQHVKLQQGNRKTGVNCWTVSILPIVDCCNCGGCVFTCYDGRNDMIYPSVIADRARNSAIHKVEPQRYWSEIDKQIKANFVTELRLNVGGDLTDEDFKYVRALGRSNPNTMILFFTKNYDGINKFLDEDSFPSNVKPIMSAWEGMECDNRHNLPMSHVLYEDGRTTAPEYGATYCGGNCSECAFKGEGCWNLKRGEHVIFRAH